MSSPAPRVVVRPTRNNDDVDLGFLVAFDEELAHHAEHLLLEAERLRLGARTGRRAVDDGSGRQQRKEGPVRRSWDATIRQTNVGVDSTTSVAIQKANLAD